MLAAAIAYLCRHPLGVAESTISTELGLSKLQSGILMGTFFWTYAIFQLPGGWLGHVWGNRWTLSLCAAGWSLAMLLTALSTSFALLLLILVGMMLVAVANDLIVVYLAMQLVGLSMSALLLLATSRREIEGHLMEQNQLSSQAGTVCQVDSVTDG